MERSLGSLPAMLPLLVLTVLASTVSSASQSQYSLFSRVHPAHPTQVPAYLQPANTYQAPYQEQDQLYQPQTYQAPAGLPAAAFKSSGSVQPKEVVPIIAYSNDLAYDGTYSYNYETGDGVSRQESGVMNNRGTPEEAPAVSGSYSYTDPDGRLVKVTYTADENGFRAEGDHLPTPPPIPDAILRSLEYIAAKQRVVAAAAAARFARSSGTDRPITVK